MLTQGIQWFLHSQMLVQHRLIREREINGYYSFSFLLNVWIEHQLGPRVSQAPRAFWVSLATTFPVSDLTVPSPHRDGEGVLHQ